MFLHAFPDLPDIMDEGLCQLVEYLWLEGRKTPETAVRLKQMVQSKDPIYGEGLRQARARLSEDVQAAPARAAGLCPSAWLLAVTGDGNGERQRWVARRIGRG